MRRKSSAAIPCEEPFGITLQRVAGTDRRESDGALFLF